MKNIKGSINKARKLSRNEILNSKDIDWLDFAREKDKSEKVVFSVTYNPALPDIGKILHSLKPVLDSSERCKSDFRNGIIVGYRRGRNLNDMLVSRRMPTGLQPISIDDQSTIVNTIEKVDKSKCNICNRRFINERAAKIQKSHNHKDQTINDAVDKGF